MKSMQRKFGTFMKRSENEEDIQSVLTEFKAVDDMLDRVRSALYAMQQADTHPRLS